MYNNPMSFVVQGMMKELAEEGEITAPRWVSVTGRAVNRAVAFVTRRVSRPATAADPDFSRADAQFPSTNQIS